VDENGPTADAEEAGAALAVTPAREGYPLSPASATVVPWEMPAEHRGHEMAAGGGAPSAQEMMGHGGAAGMSVDSMVRDMRNRSW
jgi:Cu2+-exporting ATPase